MKNTIRMAILALGTAAFFFMAGCSSTASYSESELAKAKMRHGCSASNRCQKRECKHCSKTIYTAKDRMTDEVYK